MENMLHLKSKNQHSVCVIYEGICTFKDNYIAKTKWDVEIWWEEH